jgi:hypothetical protein
MKHSSCLPLFMFLQCWTLHLLQALCLVSFQSFELLKLESSPNMWQWSEHEMRWRR